MTFIKGRSGNLAGRPKGSRNKLGEAFVAEVFADWTEYGADAIRRGREEDPAAYLRVVASLIPKQFEVKADDPYRDVTDDELAAMIQMLKAQIRESGDTVDDLGEPRIQ